MLQSSFLIVDLAGKKLLLLSFHIGVELYSNPGTLYIDKSNFEVKWKKKEDDFSWGERKSNLKVKCKSGIGWTEARTRDFKNWKAESEHSVNMFEGFKIGNFIKNRFICTGSVVTRKAPELENRIKKE